jgi:hypothetical protein
MTTGRVGEGRNPLSVLEARVPAGVVHSQVRVDHHIHFIGSEARGSQIREEARVRVRERGQRPVLPAAGAPVSMRIVLPSLRSTQVCSAPT